MPLVAVYTMDMEAVRSALHCFPRVLAVLGSLLALGAACSDDRDQVDDDYRGPLPQDIVGASTAGVSVEDGGTDIDGGTTLDLGGLGDGGVKADASRGPGWEPPVLECIPYCAGSICGSPDGCGGYCMMACDCVPSCGPDDCFTSDGCGGLCNTGCCAPFCYTSDCGVSDGCGGICNGGCGSCIPSCGASDCGVSDGCGGICSGGCDSCVPSCGAFDCGTLDGCGGTCNAGCADDW